jgi:hypothetical protein
MRNYTGDGILTAALAGIVLLATACGGSASGSPAAAGSTRHQKAVAYARCMRSHGVPSFPDPTSQGNFIVNGIDEFAPQTQRARSACQQLNPNGQATAAQQQQIVARELKFSKCMRSHGVPSYPDPSVQNGSVGTFLPSSIDTSTPQFQSAQQACQRQAGPGGGS